MGTMKYYEMTSSQSTKCGNRWEKKKRIGFKRFEHKRTYKCRTLVSKAEEE